MSGLICSELKGISIIYDLNFILDPEAPLRLLSAQIKLNLGGTVAEKVRLSKDGTSIDFVVTDSIPTSLKKFRQSPEIEGFYRFMFENDLQKEAYEILDRIITERKAKKTLARKEAKEATKEAAKEAAVIAMAEKAKAQAKVAPVKVALAKVAAKPAAKAKSKKK